MLAATASLPISDTQLRNILNSLTFIIDPVALAAADTASAISSSSTTDTSELMPSATMSSMDVKLLRTLLQHDRAFADAVKESRFQNAVQYWNVIIHRNAIARPRLVTSEITKQLHFATEASLIKGLEQLSKADKQYLEQQLVTHQFVHNVNIDMTPRTATEVVFSTYERQFLNEQVPKHKKYGSKRISWTRLAATWRMRYQTEVVSQQLNRLNLRDSAVLKAMYQSMHRYDEGSEAEQGASQPTAGSVDIPDDATVPLTADSSAPLSESKTVVEDQPSVTTGTGNGTRWKPEPHAKFVELYTTFNGQWSYDQFKEVWPAMLGHVDRAMWRNKIGSLRKSERGQKRKRSSM